MLKNLIFLPRRRWLVVLLINSFLICTGCRSHPASPATQPHAETPLLRYEYAQVHMGMQVRLVVYAKDEPTAIDACSAAFDRVKQIDDIASDYRSTSELMKLCAKAGSQPVPVSDDLFLMLTHAVEVSHISGGTFDITVGPYVALWRNARKTKQFPKEEDLQKAKALVGWQKITLNPVDHTVRLAVPGMKLDLGGLAKGYAGDCAIAVLKKNGIASALYEAGGDIVVSDPPPQSNGWIIEIVNDQVGNKPRKIAVKNAGVSTSGSTEQFVIFNGQRYSHIIDPRTGLGMTDPTLVTIVAANGITSDSLSKPACILGPEGSAGVLKHYPGVKAYFRRGD
jgi:thiamine biosynthesis lipoprotein